MTKRTGKGEIRAEGVPQQPPALDAEVDPERLDVPQHRIQIEGADRIGAATAAPLEAQHFVVGLQPGPDRPEVVATAGPPTDQQQGLTATGPVGPQPRPTHVHECLRHAAVVLRKPCVRNAAVRPGALGGVTNVTDNPQNGADPQDSTPPRTEPNPMSIFSARESYDRKHILDAAARARTRGRHKKAVELYRRLLVMERENPEIHARIAPLLATTGQDLDAWASYRVAARALIAGRRPEQALALYKEATRLLPHQIEAWKTTAQLQLKLGRKREAFETLLEGRRHFDTALSTSHSVSLLRLAHSIEPWHPQVILDLSRCLARSEQRFEALHLLDELAGRCEGSELRRIAAARFRMTGAVADLWRWMRTFWGAEFIYFQF